MENNEHSALVQVRDLTMDFRVRHGSLRVIDHLDLDLEKHKITAVIGESGSGKSTVGNTILGLYPGNARVNPEARIIFDGKNLLELSASELRQYRWQKASMVFQSAQNSLNPTLRIEEQLLDSIFDHQEKVSYSQARERVAELLELVHLDVSRVLSSFPHEVSGGMKQRVIIAMAMTLEPELLILDEPTTALDVLTQHYVFEILAQIHAKKRLTMMLITHDIELAARIADVVVILYGGEVMEKIPAATLFAKQGHPYTKGLIDSIPRITQSGFDARPIPGHPPDLRNKPTGCVFHPRCERVIDKCRATRPDLASFGEDWLVSCHLTSGWMSE